MNEIQIREYLKDYINEENTLQDILYFLEDGEALQNCNLSQEEVEDLHYDISVLSKTKE
jgi:hypothetical protein